MSKQSWRGSTLLNPEPPVLVSCGGLEQPNLITIGWTGTICTQPSMVSISVRPERYSHHLIKEIGQFAINLPTEQLVRAVDWCGVKSGRDNDKFAACKLHPKPAPRVHPARRPAKSFVADTHLDTPAKQPVNLRKRLANFPQIFGRFQHAPYCGNRDVRKLRARNR